MARGTPDYDEIQIRLSPSTDGSYGMLIMAPRGVSRQGRFDLPFSDTEIENFRLKFDPSRASVRGTHSPELALAREFGGKLFDALLRDEAVRDVYASARGRADGEQRGLRLMLSLSAAPELMIVPWEFLYHRPTFLAQSVWSPVVRYLDLSSPPLPLKIGRPLRVLGMVSAPAHANLASLDVEQEKTDLEAALKVLVDAGDVEVCWLPSARLRDLQREVAHGKDFHVFHFVGHGEYDPAVGEGSLVLEDERGGPVHVSGEQLGGILCDRRTLRLAVLNACEGAATAPTDPLAGVATNLLAHGVPAVVGMQFAITDDAAITFAEEFYATLADGEPVDAAVTEARRAISSGDHVQWATPVLFMRVPDGGLFEFAHREPREREPRPDTEQLPKARTAPSIPGPEVPDGARSAPAVVVAGEDDVGPPKGRARPPGRRAVHCGAEMQSEFEVPGGPTFSEGGLVVTALSRIKFTAADDVLAVSEVETLHLFETATGSHLNELSLKRGLLDFSFSNDRRYVATATSAVGVEVWEEVETVDGSRTWRSVARPSVSKPSSTRARSVAMSPDGHLLAVGGVLGDAAEAYVFEIPSGQRVVRIKGHRRDETLATAFDRDGGTLFTLGGTLKETASTWEVPSGKKIGERRIPERQPRGVLAPSGVLIVALRSGELRVVAPDGRTLRSFHGTAANKGVLAISEDARLLAVSMTTASGGVGPVVILRVSDGAELLRLPDDERAARACFSADSHLLATMSGPTRHRVERSHLLDKPGRVRIWRLPPQ